MKIIAVFALILATAINCGAQDITELAERPGTFEILSRTNYASSECGFTQAEMTANFERLKEIIAVVRQNPVMSDIKGFMGRAAAYNVNDMQTGSLVRCAGTCSL